MPEIAEVRLSSDLYLKKYLLGEKLEDLEILSGKYTRKKPANFLKFQEELPAKVTGVHGKGKFIWIEFDNDWIVGMGFGMTGKFTLDPDDKHNRIGLYGGKKDVYYSDMRNFGNWYFWNDPECLQKKLSELGPDLLEDDKLSKKVVVERFREHNNWEITKALMSQKIFAGTGNYIKNETLYETKVYPFAQVKDLSDETLYKLYQNAVKVAKRAYRMQKTSIAQGLPYEKFQEHMKVYSHYEDPQGHKIIRSKTKDKRTTHWVKEVQTIGKK